MNKEINREKIKESITHLLIFNIGFGVELFLSLSIDQLEDGRFRIFDQRDWDKDLCNGKEYIFEDVNEAVEKFLTIREERELGYDFERE